MLRKLRRTKSLSGSLDVFGKTDLGKVRAGNEDFKEVLIAGDAPNGIDAIMVVADGMGGHAAGEVASEMTVKGVIRHLRSQSSKATTPRKAYPQLLGKILSKVNQEVHQAGQKPEHNGMGTTCTAAVLKDDQLHIAHVGDSRAYILRNGKLHQITKDHSWVEEQVAAGLLKPEQAANHPQRNVITRAIGLDNQVKIDTFTKDIRSGDRVLICSDGLHSVVTDNTIRKVISDDRKAAAICTKLIELANKNGGPDNITVIVAKFKGSDGAANTKRIDRTKKSGSRQKRRGKSGPLGWLTRLLRKQRS